MACALTGLTAAQPDTIATETGLPGTYGTGTVRIFTHGASAASGVAAP
ncbi:hypothetical protein [Streptomyces sp. NPDC018322]